MPLTAHVLDLDPDYRRQPKTEFFCCLCQRDIKGDAAGWLHFLGDGHTITDAKDFDDPADMGLYPVGPECARKVRRIVGHSFLHQHDAEVR